MNLENIKDFLDDLVVASSVILDLEITIINANPLNRVSSTGYYKNRPKEEDTLYKGWEGSYSYKSIQEKKPFVELELFADQGSHYRSIVVQPIIVGSEAIGAIVLASFNEKQHENLVNMVEEYANYLEKIALMISAKFEREQLINRFQLVNNQLSTIFESTSDGLILYDDKGDKLQINDYAKAILNVDDRAVYDALLGEISLVVDKVLTTREDCNEHIYGTVFDYSYSIMVKGKIVENQSSCNVILIINKFEYYQNMMTQHNDAFDNEVMKEIISNNKIMKGLLEKVRMVSNFNSNILITGESGTGKELFARNIHLTSSRRDKPFVAVNCAAIPEALLESELFGYEEGVFTGGKKGGKIGKFLLANKGTLFLDEIGDMPLYLQSKLLRVINDQKLDVLGSSKLIDLDIHLIAATNKDIDRMVLKKEFREDLYYRLNVLLFHIPPLIERTDDIMLLSTHFLEKYNKKYGKRIEGFNKDVEDVLLSYKWPGNVRELENCIEYMVCFEMGQEMSISNMPEKFFEHYNSTTKMYEASQTPMEIDYNKTLKQIVRDREREVIDNYISKYEMPLTRENVKEICQKLKISMASFYRKKEA